MKQYHKNPRKISKKQFESLDKDLRELGDLSGVVHDLNSDEIIGGNQRSRVFDVNKCAVEIVSSNEQPDEQGTVAHGFIVWQGKRYAYRQVRWTPEQCERANIRANLAGGDWDFDTLSSWETSDLQMYGFDNQLLKDWNNNANNLKEMLQAEKAEGQDAEPQVDRAAELLEKWKVRTGDMFGIGAYYVCPKCGKVHKK